MLSSWRLSFIIILSLFFFSHIGSAVDVVQYNNLTDDDSIYIHPAVNQIVNYQLIHVNLTGVNWTYDGTAASETSTNYNKSFSEPGTHNITAFENVTNNTFTWVITVTRTKSTSGETHGALNETWYNSLLDSMEGSSPDFVAFLMATVSPFTAMMGNLFWVFLYVLPLAAIWIRQEKAIMPAFLGILFGTFFLGQLPEGFVGPAVLFIILTIVGLIYSLVRER